MLIIHPDYPDLPSKSRWFYIEWKFDQCSSGSEVKSTRIRANFDVDLESKMKLINDRNWIRKFSMWKSKFINLFNRIRQCCFFIATEFRPENDVEILWSNLQFQLKIDSIFTSNLNQNGVPVLFFQGGNFDQVWMKRYIIQFSLFSLSFFLSFCLFFSSQKLILLGRRFQVKSWF